MTGLPHIMLGSVAERVVELAHCPVVVVKSEKQGQRKKDKKKKEKKMKKLKIQQIITGRSND